VPGVYAPMEEHNLTADEASALEYIRRLVDDFPSKPAANGQALRDFAASRPDVFATVSWPLLKSKDFRAGHRYLTTLLVQHNDSLQRQLCDPAVFSRDEAITIARHVAKVDPLIDTRLARRLAGLNGSVPSEVDGPVGERILEILDAVSEGTRAVPVLSHLVNCPNLRLRSKAALLIGRRVQNTKWTEKHLVEVDGRVRANAIEALWGVDSEEVRTMFRHAALDVNNRVAGNALLGLYRMGELAAIPKIAEMAAHSNPAFRATAAWVMGQTGDARFAETLATMMREENTAVRTAVFRGLGKLKQSIAQVNATGLIDLSILGIGTSASGRRRLVLSARAKSGQILPGLPATSFVIREANRLITEYEPGEIVAPEVLTVGLVLSREEGIEDDQYKAAEEGAMEALANKRVADLWAVLKMRPTPAVSFSWQGQQQADTEEAPEPVRFIANGETVARTIDGPSAKTPHPSAIVPALRALLASAANSRGSRHVILLAGSVHPPADALYAARSAAQAHRSVIHAVSTVPPGEANSVEDLVRSTGGCFVSAADPRAIVAAYRRIGLWMLHRYVIRYNAQPNTVPSNLKAQIFSLSYGFGEDVFVGA
jgi:hypothetical protein